MIILRDFLPYCPSFVKRKHNGDRKYNDRKQECIPNQPCRYQYALVKSWSDGGMIYNERITLIALTNVVNKWDIMVQFNSLKVLSFHSANSVFYFVSVTNICAVFRIFPGNQYYFISNGISIYYGA